MAWSYKKKVEYALCVDESALVLTESKSGDQGQDVVHTLCRARQEQSKEKPALRLTSCPHRKVGTVAMTLPLSAFLVVTLNVPLVSRESVQKLLPFNLAKLVDQPITDYIYDWQVSRVQKDTQYLTVFLYLRTAYDAIAKDLQQCRKQIVVFEADVFSACSYLAKIGEYKEGRALLCVLIWEHSVSIAVYESEQVVMVRSLDLDGISKDIVTAPQPQDLTAQEDGEEDQSDERLHGVLDSFFLLDDEVSPAPSLFPADDVKSEPSDFLAREDLSAGPLERLLDADLTLDQNEEATPVSDSLNKQEEEEEQEQEQEQEQELSVSPGSIQRIALEVMRTVDYHTAVLKGAQLDKIFIGGETEVVDTLARELNQNINVQIQHFPPHELEADCSAVFAALSVGALHR